jgi:hypothetical protein
MEVIICTGNVTGNVTLEGRGSRYGINVEFGGPNMKKWKIGAIIGAIWGLISCLKTLSGGVWLAYCSCISHCSLIV